ncbi:MAG: CBS domain-containing protein [Myxococcaceae bacterium]
MLCRDLKLRPVYTCGENDPVERCARTMREENIGLLPVVNAENEVLGVLTDRDLALRIVAEGKSPTARAAEAMTSGPLFTCGLDEEIRSVEARMAHEQKSRAVMLDAQGRCIGVVSLSDIAAAEEQARTGQLYYDVTRRESETPPVPPLS